MRETVSGPPPKKEEVLVSLTIHALGHSQSCSPHFEVQGPEWSTALWVTVLYWDCPLLDKMNHVNTSLTTLYSVSLPCKQQTLNTVSITTEISLVMMMMMIKKFTLAFRSPWDAPWSSHKDLGEVPWQLPSKSRQRHPTHYWQESWGGVCVSVCYPWDILFKRFFRYQNIRVDFLTLFLPVLTSLTLCPPIMF